jgi:urease accessory protein
MNRNHWIKTVGIATLAGTGSIALAHVGADGDGHHGFVSGFLHPITGLDHLAAMVAVGVWSAATTRRFWIAPIAFALTLFAGALLAQGGVAFPAIEPMIAASMLVVGLLLAARAKLPEAAGALLVGAFALFHGAAHGQELGGLAALLGMVAGTALLHVVGMGLGQVLVKHSPWWTRAAGAVVALMGLNMGWGLLAA